jgi:hypothetical protein
MVVVGKLVATNSVVGRATTINGLLAEVRISSPWGQVLTADFPIQNAEVQITSFGNTSTAAQRASVLHNALQLLHSVLATSIVYTGMPQPAGPPMALRVTAVGPGLGPYNPMQGNQGIPIEVVRYHLAQVPTTSYVCQTVVRQQGKVVGYAASDHGAHGPGSPPVPPGYSPQNPAEAVQLSGPTFKGVPADATVTCRPEQAQAP